MSNRFMVLDQHNRPMRDLRISVTDKCNFRCSYCMPPELIGPDYEFLRESEQLTFDEIERLAKIFVACGVHKIRLTGGEPLLRNRLPELVQRLSLLDNAPELSLTTNGSLLGELAEDLFAAGMRRINVSLDALDDEIMQRIVNRKVKVSDIIRNIDIAKEVGLSVKVNAVIRKGLNDEQVLPLARLFKERSITLRFIEFMDVGMMNGWNLQHVVPAKAIHDQIHKEIPLEPIDQNYYGEVAKRYRYKDTDTEIGFISSVSEPFCSDCTRARLSSDGKMYLCLFAERGYDLRDKLRNGVSDQELLQHIQAIWNQRDDRYSELRSNYLQEGRLKDKIEMSYIGG
jgi:GTP 3',8-cyclase